MYQRIMTELLSLREQMEQFQIPLIDQISPSNVTWEVKSKQRQVARTLSKLRALHEELNFQLYSHPTERPSVQSPADCFEVLNPFLGFLDHEELWVVDLDTRNRIMNLVKLYQGSVNSSQVRISEIFRQAIVDNSPALILAHNHPSGDPSPSPDDVAVTRSAFQAGKLLDIDVLDHLVIGRGRYVSLKERGLGFGA
jgi:DNA repair protein RadC